MGVGHLYNSAIYGFFGKPRSYNLVIYVFFGKPRSYNSVIYGFIRLQVMKLSPIWITSHETQSYNSAIWIYGIKSSYSSTYDVFGCL
jgi:hypothetical protein